MNYLVELGILMASWDVQISMKRIVRDHVVEIIVKKGSVEISKVRSVSIEEAAQVSLDNSKKWLLAACERGELL